MRQTQSCTNRQVVCPCCEGKGYYIARFSPNSFIITEDIRFNCECCKGGLIDLAAYQDSGMEAQYGPAKMNA